ncbi:hypothetical protein NET02_11575 [Thermomicrobiaceae bacterium CFH 74404]|uniref:Uncharacterized protein n=1 Tax=Thermalbibacter longus TaxID=2951981 RepID=A0AA42BBI3_9BACT|nr:hypothetical protein [Thermalbibacter longus]MCM8749790.1 hypothetical protein [Thermalbibacter longus]
MAVFYLWASDEQGQPLRVGIILADTLSQAEEVAVNLANGQETTPENVTALIAENYQDYFGVEPVVITDHEGTGLSIVTPKTSLPAVLAALEGEPDDAIH